MKRFDKIIFGIIIGSSFPLFLAMTAFMIWFYTNRDESIVLYYIISGFITGLLIDSFVLKGILKRLYSLPVWVLISLYLFFSIYIYGFFMGFPIVNLLMGVLAGYYYSRRMVINKTGLEKTVPAIIKISTFTALIILLFCLSTGIMLLFEKNVGLEIQNMLKLGFVISDATIFITIVFGTITLVACQYYLTRFVLIKTITAQFQNAY